MSELSNKILSNLSLLFIFVAIDQLSKYLIRLSDGFYICNYNISWGIPVSGYLFIVLWTAAVFTLIFILFKQPRIFGFRISIFSVTMILSGAVSNLIDRIFLGCVFDFIDLKFWPVFNLADVFIVFGAVILLVNRKKI